MRATAAAACPVCEQHAESVFRVEGMDCHEEVAVLERRIGELTGLEDLAVDLMSQRLRVKYDAARLSASAIATAVAETGMRAWLEHEGATVAPFRADRMRVALVIGSGAALLAGVLLQLAGASALATGSFYGMSIVSGGVHTARRAAASVRGVSLDINVLMLVAVSGALAIGEWFEAAMVVFLFGLAQLLESRSMERARGAIRALMELTPVAARVRRGGAERRVGVEEIRVGEVLIIQPGEKIPLDGRVASGDSYVNQAPVTGESLPVERRVGDAVFAGTINGRGALEVEVTRLHRDSTFARIIHLVERAQSRRAPTQALVDRFARYYTPAVLILAAGIATVPPVLLGASFTVWFYRALVLLVISCPCALVISTPVSIVSALAAAARRGVLIKGGAHLERTASVRCVAFDKTGTLTKGRLEVTEVVPLGRASPVEILRTAAALEVRSEHPVAEAIVTHAAAVGVEAAPAIGFQSLPGRGAEGRVGRARALIGNHRLFEERGLCGPLIEARLAELAARGSSAVLVANDETVIGVIGVADAVRDTGRDAVDLLRSHGIGHQVLLTGDSVTTARTIATAIGVDEFRADLLPEDKVAAVEELRRRYGGVAMVGDGVNDAPALAAADVGIAMGVAGTDAALETADITLISDELLKIPYAVRLSRATLRNIRTNLGFALGLKGAFLAMAVAGVATLWMAVLADTGASLIVIANALRLLRTS